MHTIAWRVFSGIKNTNRHGLVCGQSNSANGPLTTQISSRNVRPQRSYNILTGVCSRISNKKALEPPYEDP
ncbi:hypothetical protein ILUMI_15389, partial [Ignelater luminosus]